MQRLYQRASFCSIALLDSPETVEAAAQMLPALMYQYN